MLSAGWIYHQCRCLPAPNVVTQLLLSVVGVEVLKHGRRGKPHTRKFTYIDGRLCWNNGKKSFHMREVVGVVEGMSFFA